MRLFDTHSHYTDPWFDSDRDETLQRAFEAGVEGIVTCSAEITDLEPCRALAEKYERVYFAAGVHPEGLGSLDMDAALSQVESYLSHPKCVAVGECGLDYYWAENPPREVQKAWFERQCQLAVKHGKPIIVHDREAHGDTFDILKKYKPKAIVHCYSGSDEMARQYAKMGFFIAFGGVVTFKKTDKVAAAMLAVPDENLLIETDCPYLAPVPYRGGRCESAYIRHSLEKMAELRGMDAKTLAKITTENAYRAFQIKNT